MKKTILIFCSLVLAILSTQVRGEPIKKIYLDKKNNVHLVTAQGQHQQITSEGNATSIKLSPDNETASWLVMNTWTAEGDDKPGSEKLILYRDGKSTSIKCTPFIRDYWFWMNGTQIAIDCGGRHFAGQEILYSTRTLKKIARIDQSKVPLAQRPDWANGDD